MIQIIGYNVLNGNMHYKSSMKRKWVNGFKEVDEFQVKQSKRWTKKLGYEVNVFAVFRRKIA